MFIFALRFQLWFWINHDLHQDAELKLFNMQADNLMVAPIDRHYCDANSSGEVETGANLAEYRVLVGVHYASYPYLTHTTRWLVWNLHWNTWLNVKPDR